MNRGDDPLEPVAGHHRHRGHPATSEDRLRELGRRLPSGDHAHEPVDRRKVTRAAKVIAVLVIVVAVVVAVVHWFSPIPRPGVASSLPASFRLPGSPPRLPWPPHGSASVAVTGGEALGHSGTTGAVPVAGLATVMTAYVILHDHPLALGASGPTIPVPADVVAAAGQEAASQQGVVPVATGESLTELQVLEGLLVAQGNDMATLLADWDAGSTAAFVAKMNTDAQQLGLASTRFTDPSGLETSTVSTPADLIRLGQAAMAVPVLAATVSLPQVTLPLAGTVYNLDFDLGTDGIEGMKTGSDSASGGCFLFAAQESVGGQNVTVVGAVLGQGGYSPVTTAVDQADALVRAVFASIHLYPEITAGRPVGNLTAPWSAAVPVVTTSAITVAGWPGLTVPVTVRAKTLPKTLPAGSVVATLDVGSDTTTLRSTRSLSGPSPLWRASRL
jgi:serine-type D-Ala-D-Ala carboxypeptidase (penicillin-binding protein 5/6)